MGSMIVTCPHCGLKTLTTHSVCLHCDKSLGAFAAPSTATPPERQPIKSGPLTPPPEPPPPPADQPPAESSADPPPPAEAKESEPETPAPREPTPPPGVRRRRLMRPTTEDTDDEELWPPRGRAAGRLGARGESPRRMRQAKPHRTQAEDVPQIKPMRRGTCPAGHGHLSPGHIGEHSVQHCKTCHSMWVSHEVFRQFLLMQARQVLADGTIPPLGRRDLTQPPDDRPPVLCPHCTRPMKRHSHRLIPGVPLDMCEDHGLWLRDKELQAVMRYVGQAGHDVAQRLVTALGG